MKCTINYRCPMCRTRLYGDVSDEKRVKLECPLCKGQYWVELKFGIVDGNDSFSYDTQLDDDEKKLIDVLNRVIKLYKEETNYFVIDLKRTEPDIDYRTGPVAELEEYVLENNQIPWEVLDYFTNEGYKVDVSYDREFIHLRMEWN